MTNNSITAVKKDIVLEVQGLIEQGLIQGYKQNIFFTQNYTDLQSRVIEYLIVVNVAQKLEPLSLRGVYINLEYPLNEFYNNAFPLFIFEGGFFDQNYIKRKKHSPEDSKSKRIDIVLTSDSTISGELGASQKSLIGIEIKSINQSDKKIIKANNFFSF